MVLLPASVTAQVHGFVVNTVFCMFDQTGERDSTVLACVEQAGERDRYCTCFLSMPNTRGLLLVCVEQSTLLLLYSRTRCLQSANHAETYDSGNTSSYPSGCPVAYPPAPPRGAHASPVTSVSLVISGRRTPTSSARAPRWREGKRMTAEWR